MILAHISYTWFLVILAYISPISCAYRLRLPRPPPQSSIMNFVNFMSHYREHPVPENSSLRFPLHSGITDANPPQAITGNKAAVHPKPSKEAAFPPPFVQMSPSILFEKEVQSYRPASYYRRTLFSSRDFQNQHWSFPFLQQQAGKEQHEDLSLRPIAPRRVRQELSASLLGKIEGFLRSFRPFLNRVENPRDHHSLGRIGRDFQLGKESRGLHLERPVERFVALKDMEGEAAVRDFLLAAGEEGGFHSLKGFDVVEEVAGGCAEVGPLIGAVAVGLGGEMVRIGIGDAVRAWSFRVLAMVGERGLYSQIREVPSVFGKVVRVIAGELVVMV
ncbi:hypothetical protein KC356_g57 [Hortaea werneckii]|nr:hypothetical protein KC356_g57 [Hortaea werneckii]